MVVVSRERVRIRIAPLALALLVLLDLVLVVGADRTNILLPQSLRPIVNDWMAGPFRLISFRLRSGELITAITALFVVYFIVLGVIHKISPRAVIGAVVALHVFALLAPPMFSTDVFSYQAYARMFSEYSINPYLHGPSTIGLDPISPYIGARWIGTPSVYGPIFTLISSLLAHLSIPLFELIFKLIAFAASLFTCRLIWITAKLRGASPVAGVALYGLNPLTTLYGTGGGHNDMWMVLFSTAGVWALLRGREKTSGLLVATGTAVKLTGALIAPFAFAADGPPIARARRLRFGISFGLGFLLTTGVGAIWFGTGLLRMPVTLENVQNIEPWGSFPGVAGAIFGTSVSRPVGRVLGFATVLLFLWLIRRVWRNRMDWIEAAAWLTVMTLATANSVLPWYIVWLLPLVALTTRPALWRATHILTGVIAFLAIASFFPGGSFLGL